MNWNKTFKKVKEALGFELYDWQKDYISMKIDHMPVSERRTGKTTAFILRYLLNYEVKIHSHKKFWSGPYYVSLFPVDEYWVNHAYIHGWYPGYVMEIDRRLKSVGLETCFY